MGGKNIIKQYLQFSDHTVSDFNQLRKTKNFTTKVMRNDRITSCDHFEDIRFLELTCPDCKYEPGDTLVVRSKNSPSTFARFHRILEKNNVYISENETFTTSQINKGVSFDSILTCDTKFEELCTNHLDLTAVPKRTFFQNLLHLTNDKKEMEKCLKLSSNDNSGAYLSYISEPRKSILDVLKDFPHATRNITKDILPGLFPVLKPRVYSIASSCKFHGPIFHILLAIEKYKTKFGRTKTGLVSHYLSNLENGDTCTAWINKSLLKFPEDRTIPIIMVGLGTGIAPFRNYVFDRYSEMNCNPENLLLIFECKNSKKDFLCKADLEYLHGRRALTLITAFSHEYPNSTPALFREKVLENKEIIWQALERGGYIFVAGNLKGTMPEKIKESFVMVCSQAGNKKLSEAGKYIKLLENTGRYQIENYCQSENT